MLVQPDTTDPIEEQSVQTAQEGDGHSVLSIPSPFASRPIRHVLIANNGMAAVKCIRSIKRWAYEAYNDHNYITFTVMATEHDWNCHAEYLRMADHIVPSGTANLNFANVDLIVDIAERTKAQAVWVGWGFASENPVLAEKLSALPSQPVFIGPPPNAMRSLGDKIASTIVAQSAHVPTVDWSGAGIEIDPLLHRDEEGFVFVPEELYEEATIRDVEKGLQHALRIGFPVMIKASEGGGGKGIRLVQYEQEFAFKYNQVAKEVPGSPIFIMKVAQDCRHLEVQLLADMYGNAIALFGRDCSVQRRHQKIIEEAPITVASQDILDEMEAAAVRLAKLVGYVSAGTVEYLYSPATKQYFFLELNPRLQVEHPTTEMVSGVNIPAAQLQIAMGIPLHGIKDIRLLYGQPPTGNSEIDFDFTTRLAREIQRKPSPRGHVIATRITAENPDAGFKPNSGTVQELNFRSSSNVWGYFSVNSCGGVHEYADSQFGHVFSYGETREAARRNLVVALKELSIRGDFRTTVDYLVKLLETDMYVKNTVTTAWLDSLITAKVETDKPDSMLTAVCGAVCKTMRWAEKNRLDCEKALEKGQPIPKSALANSTTVDFIYNSTRFVLKTYLASPELVAISNAHASSRVLAGNDGLSTKNIHYVGVKKMVDGGFCVSIGGKSHYVYCQEEANSTVLSVDAKVCRLEKDSDPTKLKSPSPGKLVRYLIEDGDHVASGEAFAEIEVMKMYMPLLATESGVIKLKKPAGSVLQTGDIVGELVLDDPSRVKQVALFDGVFPSFGPPECVGDKCHRLVRHVKHRIDSIMSGYHGRGRVSLLVRHMLDLVRQPELPYLEFQEALSSVSGRIPASLEQQLLDCLREASEAKKEFPTSIIQFLMDETVESIAVMEERNTLSASLMCLQSVLSKYQQGLKHYERQILLDLVQQYYTIEEMFESDSFEQVLKGLREKFKSQDQGADHVISIAMAYVNAHDRSELILSILDLVRISSMDGHEEGPTFLVLKPIVEKLASLCSNRAAKVSLKAREFLLFFQMPSYTERKNETYTILKSAVRYTHSSLESCTILKEPEFDYQQIVKLITADYSILDVLPCFFYHSDVGIRSMALYSYVLCVSQAYTISAVRHVFQLDTVILEWQYVLRSSFYESNKLDSTGNEPRKTFGSFSDFTSISIDAKAPRKGLLCAFDTLPDLEAKLSQVIALGSLEASQDNGMVYVLNIGISMTANETLLHSDASCQEYFESLVKKHVKALRESFYRRVTFMVLQDHQFPRFFTFRDHLDFKEDTVIRNIEPAMAHQLELPRLRNFNLTPCFVDNRRIHMYYARGKTNEADERFFIRAIVYPGQVVANALKPSQFLVSEGNRILGDVLDHLEVVWSSHPNTDCNHLFIHFIPTFELDVSALQHCLKELVDRHGKRLWKLRITDAEIRFIMKPPGNNVSPRPVRFTISSSTGYVTRVQVYQEVRDSSGVQRYMSLTVPPGILHKQPVQFSYETKESIQPKRYKAHLMGTTFVYDFPDLFTRALEKRWSALMRENRPIHGPNEYVHFTELVVDKTGELHEIYRGPGLNTCGMVAWRVELFTPEYPEGREMVVIANDITHGIGSFGPDEDVLFEKATEFARQQGIPRIYISANSGARIGLADEVANTFKIKWIDPQIPSKGIDYLYLDPHDYQELKSVVKCSPVTQGDTVHYKLEAIIGKTHGLGVENLQGSGLIAGATSRAYDDIFTLTLVTCRSVGIGAYLARLGQRTIQVEYTPIILTGASALNKVLGREVYTSNLQLGGTQIMFKNGVSHLVAQNDMEGVQQILQWLSYIPKSVSSPLPVHPSLDAPDREIGVELPSTGPYDPRILLTGYTREDGEFVPGFFDQDSFMETMGGWAQGVVTGRARLGGIPMGVIAVETHSTETVVAADPANDASTEQTTAEAGQVWYPNSAYKTAQAIRDFNKGEQLPLIIFANWRGFSGGQNDMFKEVLKYGAYIVDALVDYKQPVFVYIIGELRGGAWVVLDSTINSDMMEMYAETGARGGVLEPEGIVEIKFRKSKLLATMERLDPIYRDLKVRLQSCLTEQEKADIKKKMVQREKEVLPLYHSAALKFADHHDSPHRMLAKGVIRHIVDWKQARKYFYWRLMRRMCEEGVLKSMFKADEKMTRKKAQIMLAKWFHQDVRHDLVPEFESILLNSSLTSSSSSQHPSLNEQDKKAKTALQDYLNADVAVIKWLGSMETQVQERIEQLKWVKMQKDVSDMIQSHPDVCLKAFESALKTLSPHDKAIWLERLSRYGN